MIPKPSINPVTLTVLWSSLISITDEMGSALRRTAFSEAVREGDDFSTGLFDAKGRLIAQGNFTPGHLGAMPYVVENVLKYVPPETLKPGDMLATNDSYLGAGHFPDVFLVAPIFEGDTLLGYAVNTAHHVDMGGAQPGSEAIQGVRDAFAEGLRILPVRLVKGGEFDSDLLRMILGNVRIPDKVRGDLLAQRNSNHVGSQRFRKLHAQYGAALLADAIEEIIDRSEARARELLSAIPDGTYSFDDQLDDYGPETSAIKFCVDVTLKDGTATVDFSRSSDAVPAGLNSYINYTRAYSKFAIRVFAGIDVPNNAGSDRAIKIVAREGSFFNPRYPAASGGRAATQVRIFEVINGAMAKAVPKRAMGAFTHWANPKISGIDPESGKRWLMYDMVMGGFGGRASGDGAEALCPVFNCANIPVEVHEINSPVRFRCLELIPDSGGDGEYRGGCGIRKDIEILAENATAVLASDRHKSHPYGLFGGSPGTIGRTVLVRGGVETDLAPKGVVQVTRGDVISLRLSGAGGYGDPAKRSAEAIENDIVDGYITQART